MNSSGIKRGLAATAVGALAVTGLPFLASSAQAADATALQLAYVGPTRDAGTVGGLLVIKTKGVTGADDFTKLKLAASNLTDPATDGQNQSVGTPQFIGFEADDEDNTFGGKDGWGEATYRVTVDTTSVGDTFKYAAYWDVDGNGTAGTPDVDTNDQRVQVTGKTVGDAASLSISPAKQTAPEGVESGDYTITVKDAGGNVTQLSDTEAVDVTSAATVNGGNFTAAALDFINGTATFTAEDTDADLYTLTATATGFTATATAQLDVVESASGFDEDNVDIVTGKDAWDGFGDGTLGANVPVRVDQQSVTLNFKSAAANVGQTVVVNVTGTGVTFGGENEKSFSTVLDGNGSGTITITPDAGTISTNDSLLIESPSFTGGDIANVVWENPELDDVTTAASTYVSGYGGSVDVTAKAVDQFGDPIEGVYLAVQRENGANEDALAGAKKATNAQGEATFTLTDTNATDASHDADDITIHVYNDPNAAPGASIATFDGGDIVYTATGQGADFVLYNDAFNTEAASYNAALNPIVPLTDAIASAANEWNEIDIQGGTPGAPVTVSATNGALVLTDGDTELADGAASVNGEVGDTFWIVGTTAGETTVTVTSGGVTKTTTMLVKVATNNLDTARNVSVSGPDKILGGETATFVVKVTDAFGNPVAGRSVGDLNIAVTGPADLQDSESVTDENGELELTVRADNDADSPITVRVRALSANGDQFGATENNELASDAPGDETAPGLAASVQSADAMITDVVNIEELEQAVENAQERVDLAEDALASARGELRVAKAERAVAKKSVKQAKKALKKAKRQHKGVKAAKRELRNERGDFRIAKAKVKAEQGDVNRAKDRLAKRQAELEAAQQALEDAQNNG